MPNCHFGLINAAVIADVQPYTILRNEARLGRLQVFYPLPELMRITFHGLATWFEDAGKITDQSRTQRWPRILRRQTVLIKPPQGEFAHICVRHALRIGLLQREPCLYCGSEPAETHHPEYRKPLWVIWLCHPHHSAHHTRVRAAGRKPCQPKIELFPASSSYQKPYI